MTPYLHLSLLDIPAGAVFLAPTQMGYPAAYPNFPAIAPHSGMMAPPVGVMAQPGGAAGMAAHMAIPAGYVGGIQTAVIGVPNGMMATQQAGYMPGMAPAPPPVYVVQPAHQLQWNLAQVSANGENSGACLSEVSFKPWGQGKTCIYRLQVDNLMPSNSTWLGNELEDMG